MHEEQFRNWLVTQGLQDRPISDALSRCRRVEGLLGSLDGHWDGDRLRGVLGKLEYSADDRRMNQPNRSGIAIEGDTYNGLASLRSAIRRYAEFRSARA